MIQRLLDHSALQELNLDHYDETVPHGMVFDVAWFPPHVLSVVHHVTPHETGVHVQWAFSNRDVVGWHCLGNIT